MNKHTVTEFVAGLRALAEWYETHPDFTLPHDPRFAVFPPPGYVRARVRALAPCKKTDFGGEWFTVNRRFGPILLDVYVNKERTCTRRVVRVEHVPEEIKPAYDREIVEWDCGPILEEDYAGDWE